MDLDVRHLRALCAIAEAGSVSRAAVRLGMSQPALTALLQRVERSLGGELFVRSRSGVRPTPLGERALQRARLVLAELDGFIGDLTGGGQSPAARLRLGSAHMDCCGTMLENVTAALPDTEITMQVESSSINLTQGLAHDRLDVAVIGLSDEQQISIAPELGQRMLVPWVPIFIALSDQHPLAQRAEIDLADLAGESWISPPGADDGSLAALRNACRRAGFEPRVRFDAPSGGGGPLIETGQAVRLVEPTSLGGRGMVIRRLAGDPLRFRLVMAWRRSRIAEEVAAEVYYAVARAYTTHALASPVFRPWWAAHPEAHPRLG
ncbi:LysR family transcriptional regulator [Longispora albida]|uniref:LysR family transcriptional regulator n=1 Tax=Longispora albida TaxID=203523 RepID=UPI000377C395|nr:LysR family transcriptional regulator [Longispora albida]